jgi:hypothetical protein
MLPTASAFTECFKENFLPNGVLLPNSAHKSVSLLYQFLVLTAELARDVVQADDEPLGELEEQRRESQPEARGRSCLPFFF